MFPGCYTHIPCFTLHACCHLLDKTSQHRKHWHLYTYFSPHFHSAFKWPKCLQCHNLKHAGEFTALNARLFGALRRSTTLYQIVVCLSLQLAGEFSQKHCIYLWSEEEQEYYLVKMSMHLWRKHKCIKNPHKVQWKRAALSITTPVSLGPSMWANALDKPHECASFKHARANYIHSTTSYPNIKY